MRIADREAYEWRKMHRKEVIAQVQRFLQRVGRRGSNQTAERSKVVLLRGRQARLECCSRY